MVQESPGRSKEVQAKNPKKSKNDPLGSLGFLGEFRAPVRSKKIQGSPGLQGLGRSTPGILRKVPRGPLGIPRVPYGSLRTSKDPKGSLRSEVRRMQEEVCTRLKWELESWGPGCRKPAVNIRTREVEV